MPPDAPPAPPSRVGDLHTVRFYPNGRLACWRAVGRELVQVRELYGRTRELWPAVLARVSEATRFMFNAPGSEKPIEPDAVEAFVRVQMGWR